MNAMRCDARMRRKRQRQRERVEFELRECVEIGAGERREREKEIVNDRYIFSCLQIDFVCSSTRIYTESVREEWRERVNSLDNVEERHVTLHIHLSIIYTAIRRTT